MVKKVLSDAIKETTVDGPSESSVDFFKDADSDDGQAVIEREVEYQHLTLAALTICCTCD